jgi:lipopolysaccharide transport system ATP-binding protein
MNSRKQQAVLSFVDVSLSYYQSRSLLNRRKIEVLDKVSFELYRGQTLGIIGRNGAGKSSLLRLMAGVLEPDSGTIVRHRDDLHTSLLTLQLGFQSHLTGRENALLGCLLMGLSSDQAERLLPDIAAFSGLAAALDNPLASYSSGMRARLGFTVAYYTKADVMLIDEVLGVGDYEFKLKSRDALLAAAASDRTAVLVSHDENFLAELCDELMWLEGGRLIMHGLPHNVLKKYHDYDHMISTLAFELKRGAGRAGRHVRECRPRGADLLPTPLRPVVTGGGAGVRHELLGGEHPDCFLRRQG